MKKPFFIFTLIVLFASAMLLIRQEMDGLYLRSLFFLVVFSMAGFYSFTIQKGSSGTMSRIRHWLEKPVVVFLITGIISSAVFFLLPGIFFDDAGFILRYLDNFSQGYWFRYNISDAPVYGISGFLHGLFCGTLCFLHITSPERALVVSNYTGFVFTAWFLYRILQKIIQEKPLVFICWFLVITSARMYLNVASCGLETSLHLSFVFGAVYFLLADKPRWFFLFSALMILSKLDAVPVACACFLFYLLLHSEEIRNFPVIKKQTFLFLGCFILPLVLGLLYITWLFGSPLPQSAYAKLYYHSHPKDHWFPFLEYFLSDRLRITVLITGLLFWLLNMLESAWKREPKVLVHGIFGTLFLSQMALYYFYNPGERMMWYYAMPELFLLLQFLYGAYYSIHEYGSWKYQTTALVLFLALFSNVIWKDVYAGLGWLKESVGMVERERMKIGEHIASISSPSDTLLSGHGLLSRPFKGYVMDLSGLNSRATTYYHLKQDSIIAVFHPDYIVNHAYGIFLEKYNRFNYELIGVYHDIALQHFPSWIVLRKYEGTEKHSLRLIDESLNTGRFTKDADVIWLHDSDGKITLVDHYTATQKILHIGVKKEKRQGLLHYTIYGKGEIINSGDFSPLQQPGISAYTGDLEINISGADSVVFYTDEKYSHFDLLDPVYELIE